MSSDSKESDSVLLNKKKREKSDETISNHQNISSLLADITFSSDPHQDENENVNSSPIDSEMNDKQKIKYDFIFDDWFSFNEDAASVENEEIRDFLSEFNKKYGTNALTIYQINDIVEKLISKAVKNNQKQLHEIKHSNEIKELNRKLTKENDELTYEVSELRSKVSNLEHQLLTLNNNLYQLNETKCVLKHDSKNLVEALDSLQDVMESQITDLDTLCKQRTNLIYITNKQANLLSSIERYAQNLETMQSVSNKCQSKSDRNRSIREANIEDELYTILCSIIKFIDNSLKHEVIKCKSIKDDSQLSVRERILMIVKYLCQELSLLTDQKAQFSSSYEKLEKEKELYLNKCCQILSLFEDQLQFMAKIPHSHDLQLNLFRSEGVSTDILLTEEAKQQIYTRCARLGKFVEETIGKITDDKFNEIYNGPDVVDRARIFDLVQATNMEECLENLLRQFSTGSEVDIKQMFELFTAMLFINSLLKSHVIEMAERITQCSHEIHKLRNETYDRDDEDVKSLKKLLKQMTKEMQKIRSFCCNILGYEDEETMTYRLVKRSFAKFQEENVKSVVSLPELTEALEKRVDSETSELKEELNKSKKAIEAFRKDAKKKQKQVECLSTVVKNMEEELNKKANIINERNVLIKDLQNQNIQLQNTIDAKNKELVETINKSQSEIEMNLKEIDRTKTLMKQYEEEKLTMENTLNEMKNKLNTMDLQKKDLNKRVKVLQATNQKIIEETETKIYDVKEQCNRTMSNLHEKYQSSLDELKENQRSIMELGSKNQQLTSELSKTNLEKKTLEMKLKSYDLKTALEQQNFQSKVSAQITAVQIEQSSKICSLQRIIDTTLQSLVAILSESAEPTDIDHAVTMVEDEMSRLRQTQYLYTEQIDDVIDSQKILGIGPSERLSPAIQTLKLMLQEKEQQIRDIKERVKSSVEESEKYRRETRRVEGKLVMLTQWENWAKRMHRVIHEAETICLSSDELRLALEESLLASVTNRAIVYRIDSLRTQKNLLLNFDKRTLSANQALKPRLRILMIVTLAARRFQRMGGYLVMGVIERPSNDMNLRLKKSRKSFSSSSEKSNDNSADLPIKNTQVDSIYSDKSRKRCSAPKKALIPLWI